MSARPMRFQRTISSVLTPIRPSEPSRQHAEHSRQSYAKVMATV